MKSLLFTTAALLLFSIGIVHSYLGERHLFRRLLALPNLPLLRSNRPFTERVIRYAWHLTSLAWWGFAVLLLVFAFPPISIRMLQWVCGSVSVLTGLVILLTVGKRHPAWLLFLLAGALTWIAAS